MSSTGYQWINFFEPKHFKLCRWHNTMLAFAESIRCYIEGFSWDPQSKIHPIFQYPPSAHLYSKGTGVSTHHWLFLKLQLFWDLQKVIEVQLYTQLCAWCDNTADDECSAEGSSTKSPSRIYSWNDAISSPWPLSIEPPVFPHCLFAKKCCQDSRDQNIIHYRGLICKWTKQVTKASKWMPIITSQMRHLCATFPISLWNGFDQSLIISKHCGEH